MAALFCGSCRRRFLSTWRISQRVAGTSDHSTRKKEFLVEGGEDGNVRPVPTTKRTPASFHAGWWKDKASEMFMPRGYPDSVASSYLSFSKWQFLHMTTGSVTGVLSMQALLYAIGLGAGSIPVAAALNWIIKDGLGQLGGVLYAALLNNRFDSDPKRYRFFSGLALQAATAVEILTPLFPQYFLLLASVSNIGKNISWLASSATRAQLHHSLALRENLGDVTGKSGSQSTAAGLAGTGIGVVLSSFIQASFLGVVGAYVPLCLLSLYSLYKSNCVVSLHTLNGQRFDLLMSMTMASFVKHNNKPLHKLIDDGNFEPSIFVPSPSQIASQESFILPYKSYFQMPLVVEPRLEKRQPLQMLTRMQEQHFQTPRPYVLCMVQGALPTLGLWFSEHANTQDIICGFYHAYCVRQIAQEQLTNTNTHSELLFQGEKFAQVVRQTFEFVTLTFPKLRQHLINQGWNMDYVFLADEAHRITLHES